MKERSGRAEKLLMYAVSVIVSMKTCDVGGSRYVKVRQRGLRETV